MNKLCSEFNFYTIPDLCHCGCNEIIYIRGKKFKLGHYSRLTEVREWKSKLYTGRPSKLKGVKHTHIVWNKGLTKNSDIRVAKQSKSQLGKIFSKQHKERISLSHADLSGNKNPRYIDGRSFLPYCEKFNRKLKNQIRQRDNYNCQLCEIKQNELLGKDKKLSVHHIHYDKENCYPDLITLCRNCNTHVNNNRKHYESLFMNKLNDRGLLFWTLSLYKEKTV